MKNKKPGKGFALPNNYRSACITALLLVCSFAAISQRVTVIHNTGTLGERGGSYKVQFIPNGCGAPASPAAYIKAIYDVDSTVRKTALHYYDSCGHQSYIYDQNTSTWNAQAGGGCVDGIKDGTGIITKLTDSTFHITPAIFYKNCNTYTTRDTTIKIPHPGDSPRVVLFIAPVNLHTTAVVGPESLSFVFPQTSSDTCVILGNVFLSDTAITLSSGTALDTIWTKVAGKAIQNGSGGQMQGNWLTTGLQKISNTSTTGNQIQVENAAHPNLYDLWSLDVDSTSHIKNINGDILKWKYNRSLFFPAVPVAVLDTTIYSILGINKTTGETKKLAWNIPGSGGGSFTLTNGEATTAAGTAVDWGGTITHNVNIDGVYKIQFGASVGIDEFKVFSGLMTVDGDFKLASTNPFHNVDDSMLVRANDGTVGYRAIPSAGGSTFYNSNIGSGFRFAVPLTNNIKTFFAGSYLLLDSSSNSNALTIKTDTANLFLRVRAIIHDSLPAASTLVMHPDEFEITSTSGNDTARLTGIDNAIYTYLSGRRVASSITDDLAGTVTAAGALNVTGNVGLGGTNGVDARVDVNATSFDVGIGDPWGINNGTRIWSRNSTQQNILDATNGTVLSTPQTTGIDLSGGDYTAAGPGTYGILVGDPTNNFILPDPALYTTNTITVYIHVERSETANIVDAGAISIFNTTGTVITTIAGGVNTGGSTFIFQVIAGHWHQF